MGDGLADGNGRPAEGQDPHDVTNASGTNGHRPRVISPRKLEANRRNAQRSTGPRTGEGKEKVRFNAVKHGLLVKAIEMNLSGIRESKVEFHQLLSSLHDELRPVGMLEELCVEQMATAYWRLRRVLRAGEIGLSRAYEAAQNGARYDAEIAKARAERQKEQDVEITLLLAQIEKELDEGKNISPDTFDKLAAADGLFPSGLFWSVSGLMGEKQATAPDEQTLTRAAARVRESVQDRKIEIEGRQGPIAAAPRRASGAGSTSVAELVPKAVISALPEVLDAYARYETMFNRQFDRAMNQLVKLQLRRTEQGAPAADFAKQTHRGS
jgi:hypothetical protein